MWEKIHQLISDQGLNVSLATEERAKVYFETGLIVSPESLTTILSCDDHAFIQAEQYLSPTARRTPPEIRKSFLASFQAPDLVYRLVKGCLPFPVELDILNQMHFDFNQAKVVVRDEDGILGRHAKAIEEFLLKNNHASKLKKILMLLEEQAKHSD